MRKSIQFALVAMAFFSLPALAKMEQVSVKILRPAAVTIPTRIQKIILADRTCGNCLHSANGLRVFSGPDTSIYSSLAGLKVQLLTTNRYSVKLAALDTALLAYEKKQLLPPLSWDAAAKITGNDPSILLIVLEREWSERLYETWVNRYTWRVYDPATKTLLDEYEQTAENYKVVRTIEDREADVVYPEALYLYACHIMPHWEWITRSYYVEGSKKMREAATCVQQNEWTKAAALWTVIAADSANYSARFEACYNLAVHYEFAGEFDKALEWIAKAEKFGDPEAAGYAPHLRRRKAEAAMTNEQYVGKQGQLPAPKR